MPNKDQVVGKIKQTAGTVRKKAGQAADDPETVLRGEQMKLEGKAQEMRGTGRALARRAAERTRKMREQPQ
jgi:uncharacterized protein YjbJ (UPF0337 family)